MDVLREQLSFLVHDYGFVYSIRAINNLLYVLEYLKENVSIRIHYEIRDNYFILDIHVKRGGEEFFISDNTSSAEFLYWQKPDVKSIDIFEFSKAHISRDNFSKQRMMLFRKAARWFLGKKHYLAVVQLYRDLLYHSIDNILEWAQNYP